MKVNDIKVSVGVNNFQNACFEENDRTIDYESSRNLSYSEIISITHGLNVISEFYDVISVASTNAIGICAVSLGKMQEEALMSVIDSNPIDFLSSTITLSKEVDSEIVKMLKNTNLVVAPNFTKNALEYLNTHEIGYVTIKTPMKDYKKYLSNEIKETPLGTLTQAPNLSDLNKDSFKVVSKVKPTVEQIEDAVFAWKVAKHTLSQAIVIAKDLKTNAIAQGLHSASVEYALDYSCERSKDAILASDLPLTLHDVNVAAQGRVGLIIVPSVTREILSAADKFNISVITTGFTNALF